MTQLLLHLIGDYLTQSDWMATRKTQQHLPAFCHALVYSLPFWLLRPSLTAWLVIFATHFFIDRYRLARYVVWAKNFMSPPVWWKQLRNGSWSSASNQEAAQWRAWIDHGITGEMPPEFKGSLTFKRCRMLPFKECSATGYPPDRPVWLAVWLLIIADNCLHLSINYSALRWL